MSILLRQAGPVIVSVIITAGYFTVIYQLFLVSTDMPEKVFQLMNILFGGLTISFGQVCNYWLGSSAGSKRKDEIVAMREGGRP